jgi:hypothetical protein
VCLYLVTFKDHPGQVGMGQARFVELDEIFQSDFAKGSSAQRFIPVLAVNGERLVVMALEKQGMGEVALAARSLRARNQRLSRCADSARISRSKIVRCGPAKFSAQAFLPVIKLRG